MPTMREDIDLTKLSDQQLRELAKRYPAAQTPGPESLSDSRLSQLAETPSSGPVETIGTGVRSVIKGVTALPAMLADATTRPVMNLLAKPFGYEFPPQGQAIDEGLSAAGLRAPHNRKDRVTSDIVEALAGAGTGIGLGKSLTTAAPKVAKFLTASPKTQALSAATGAYAGSNVREAGGSQTKQITAALAAGMAPGVLPGLAGAATRTAIRGVKPKGIAKVQSNIDNYARAGTTPTVGEAAESDRLRAVEGLLSRWIGSSGTVQGQARTQAKQIGEKVAALAENTASNTNRTLAGDKIYSGVKEVFLPNAKKIIDKEFASFAREVPPETIARADNFSTILNDLLAPIPNAGRLGRNPLVLKNRPGLEGLRADLQSAAKLNNGQGVPFEVLKKLRTGVGKDLETVGLDPNVDKATSKRLFGALTEDMRAQATAKGPRALQLFERANASTKKLHDHMDLINGVIDKNGGGELLYKAAFSEVADGPTKIKAIYNSIPKESRQYLSAAYLKNLGKATDSEAFDPGVFARRYEKMSSEARDVIFGALPGDGKKDIETIAKVVEDVRRSSKDFRAGASSAQGNTGLQMLLYSGSGALGGGIAALAGSGNAGTAALATTGIGGLLTASNVLGRLLANPKSAAWLARTNQIPPSALPAAINQYAQQAKDEDDEETFELMQQLKAQLAGEQ